MKIYAFEVEADLDYRRIVSVEVHTDLGRRVVKLAAPMDVQPSGAMPSQFRSLTELLWNVICEVAAKGSELAAAAPKAEA